MSDHTAKSYAEHIAAGIAIGLAAGVIVTAWLGGRAQRDLAAAWASDVGAWERFSDLMYQRGYEDGQSMARMAREVTP